MAFLVLPRDILAEIRRVAFRTSSETGVRLFGEVAGDAYLVRHIIGPGPRAVERTAYYECDNDYAEAQFASLLKSEPQLRFLGELHVHPARQPGLSSKDLGTIHKVLKELPFFVAGTIRRQPFGIAAFLFMRRTRKSLTCVLR
jgi:hypothetical protein